MAYKPIFFRGKAQSIRAWAREYGVNAQTLVSRLRRGIPIKDALFMTKNNPKRIKTPSGEYTAAELAKITGITTSAVYARYTKLGFKGDELLWLSLKAKVTAFGRTQCTRQWAAETGISERAITGRLCRGWTPERALSTPVMRNGQRNQGLITAFGRTKMLGEWAKEYGISPNTLYSRIKRAGLSPEVALTAPIEKKRKESL